MYIKSLEFHILFVRASVLSEVCKSSSLSALSRVSGRLAVGFLYHRVAFGSCGSSGCQRLPGWCSKTRQFNILRVQVFIEMWFSYPRKEANLQQYDGKRYIGDIYVYNRYSKKRTN
ncbi:hypothetical protein TNCV_2393831 [Trichonephila clavipes]|nr:hypothetical protein TNCV_2393831 [Trichonephila clavipes]